MTTVTSPMPGAADLRRPAWTRTIWLLAGLGLLVVLCVLSVCFGVRAVSPDDIFAALGGHDATIAQAAIVKRLPRTALAILVGAALALAGATMQAVTRNPIADPGILGVSHGAALAVVVGIAFLGLTDPYGQMALAIIGAAIAAVFVYTVGSLGRGGATPLKLALAGAATSAALASLVSAIMLPRVDLLQSFQSWQVGGVGGAEWPRIAITAPVLAVGALICFASARGMNSLALGDDMAAGLGEHVMRTRAFSALGAVILAGCRARDRRTHRIRRARRSAHVPDAGRHRSSLAPAVLGPGRRIAPGRERHRRPHHLAHIRGDPGRHHHRPHRGPVLHLDRPPAEGERAVSAAIIAGRRARHRRHAVANVVLGILLLAAFTLALMIGNTFYPIDDVIGVILGQTVPGASFTVGELRLPRAVLAVLAGVAFGMAGVSFQTLLRNPLASPDIIGISNGAGAAAVFGIVVLSLNGPVVSVLALAGAVVTAAVIYLLSNKGGFAGTRLILIGIGVAAMLQSVISYVLSRAASWDIQTAMQWLTGSLNNASWERVLPLLLAMAITVPLLMSQARSLGVMQLGDDSASGLGVRVTTTRVLFILGAVVLLAFATAATGPIAFVAFMAGPVAARITGPGANLLLPAGLVGALLVLCGDLVGQFALGARYPVGVVTGVLGAPYLIYLLIRTNRSGGSL